MSKDAIENLTRSKDGFKRLGEFNKWTLPKHYVRVIKADGFKEATSKDVI